MGIEKLVIRPGNGPKASLGQKVTVHFTGYGKYDDLCEEFYSTKDPGEQPICFNIGEEGVVEGALLPTRSLSTTLLSGTIRRPKGWDEGVMGMHVGEVARILCTPDYGYGSYGNGLWGILPNSTLLFEFELLSIGWFCSNGG